MAVWTSDFFFQVVKKKWFGVRQIIKAKKEVWANRCRCDSHLSVQLFSKQSQWGLTRVLNSQLYVTTEFYPYMCIVAVWVAEFSNGGYKVRKINILKGNY